MTFKITAQEKDLILKRRIVLSEDTKKYRVAIDILREKMQKEKDRKVVNRKKLKEIQKILLNKKIEYGKAKIDNKRDQSKRLSDDIKYYTKRLRKLSK